VGHTHAGGNVVATLQGRMLLQVAVGHSPGGMNVVASGNGTVGKNVVVVGYNL